MSVWDAKLCFCLKCGSLGAKSIGVCQKCGAKLVETDKNCWDFHNESIQGRDAEFMSELRKKYVLTDDNKLLDMKLYNAREQTEKAKRNRENALLHKYNTTPSCPRCWSFDIKKTFMSEITETIFGSSPTWFCNNCHLKWK